MPNDFYEFERVQEAVEALQIAGLRPTVKWETDTRERWEIRNYSGPFIPNRWTITVTKVCISSASEDLSRLRRVCEVHNLAWEQHDAKGMRIGPQYDEWVTGYNALREATGKITEGFCAGCEEKCRKIEDEALCSECRTTDAFDARYGALS